jgi:hypothetical protein
MSDSVRDDILRVLRDLGDEFIGPGLVLIVILVLALVFSVLIRTGGRRAGVNIRFEWNPGRGPGADRGPTVDNISVVANANDAAQPRPSRLDKLRTILVIVYRGLHLAGAIALLLGAIWAYMAATPGNGLLLVAILLFALSLIAFLSIGQYPAASATQTDRSAMDELLSKVKVSTSFATPQVHSLDNTAMARGKAMLAQGASLDDICRTIDLQYASWDHARQQAFQRVIGAALRA